MDGLRTLLVFLLGVVSLSPDWISGSVLEVTVRPGDNITLYCDCKTSSGVYVVWHRNCSDGSSSSLMDGLRTLLVVLLGVVSLSHDWISGSVLEVTVRPGDNITLYCDCKTSTGVFIVWYRNCSHENQPTLVLKLNIDAWTKTTDVAALLKPLPRFSFVRNDSSKSYDLLIMNTTVSDEGLYYCGTEEKRVDDKEHITPRSDYRSGNVTTRIIFNSTDPRYHDETPGDCGVCWMLLFSLCPVVAVLSSLLSSLVVHHFCQKTAKEPITDKKRTDTRGQTRGNKDEDVCYAALEFPQTSQISKKKKTQSSDFTTYSAVNTCGI